MSDYRVNVVDADTRRVVRVFAEHSGRITDMVKNKSEMKEKGKKL